MIAGQYALPTSLTQPSLSQVLGAMCAESLAHREVESVPYFHVVFTLPMLAGRRARSPSRMNKAPVLAILLCTAAAHYRCRSQASRRLPSLMARASSSVLADLQDAFEAGKLRFFGKLAGMAEPEGKVLLTWKDYAGPARPS